MEKSIELHSSPFLNGSFWSRSRPRHMAS
jgi:hypothetical protein